MPQNPVPQIPPQLNDSRSQDPQIVLATLNRDR